MAMDISNNGSVKLKELEHQRAVLIAKLKTEKDLARRKQLQNALLRRNVEIHKLLQGK